ncbi:MAG: recombination protein RecR [Candidatus Nealsonbacteria bacterium RBG_13_42_11]|uniref:Recombination protein RecR n=1 Tax=Candidatus Nealsonbacteria bacterium RBG_13_42_11 TaxID=1801663 RepID=A0A1G2E1N4_9BACT|nr:MAG: recombination protein RecR [Candidatus Nealsonbacteria bacterium RBG_13_42_11]
MYSKSIQKLIDLFSKFPTVGPRTASRFVFYLIGLKNEETDEIINSISALKNNVKVCSSCFKPFENEGTLCEICSNKTRDKTLLCVVEKETDLIPIEKTKKYNGLYFILGGTVSRLKKEDIQKLRVKELEEMMKSKTDIKEIILATNPNNEGEATALYLERILKPFGKKITRLGRGLPTGAELEYADGETISSAFENRR